MKLLGFLLIVFCSAAVADTVGQSGSACAAVNNSVSTKTKWDYRGVTNNSSGVRWIICPIVVPAVSDSQDNQVLVTFANYGNAVAEMQCFMRYATNKEPGFVTITRSVAVSGDTASNETFYLENQLIGMVTVTCGLKPKVGILQVAAEANY